MTGRYWQEVGERWQVTRLQRLWRRHNDRVIGDLLSRWLAGRRFHRVLKTDLFEEAGGQGLEGVLARHGDCVVGIDLSHATAGSAHHRHSRFSVVKSDVRRLPFAAASFDLIISTSTLDHFDTLDELQSSLSELHRILRPGGELLLTLDNPENPVVRLRNALPFTWLHRTGVVPYYVGVTCGRRELSSRMRRAGLAVEEIAAVLHCPRAPAIALTRWIENAPLLRAGEQTLLVGLRAWELLALLSTRFFTGYYVAVRARKGSD